MAKNNFDLAIFWNEFQNPEEGFEARFKENDETERKEFETNEEAREWLQEKLEGKEGFVDFYDETQEGSYNDNQTTGNAEKVRKEVF